MQQLIPVRGIKQEDAVIFTFYRHFSPLWSPNRINMKLTHRHIPGTRYVRTGGVGLYLHLCYVEAYLLLPDPGYLLWHPSPIYYR